MADDDNATTDFVERIRELFANLPGRDEDAAAALDTDVRAAISKITGGMSPIQLVNAYFDWLSHLAISPGKRDLLWQSLRAKLVELAGQAAAQIALKDDAPAIPLQDQNFSGDSWRQRPFNLLAHAYLTLKSWVHETSEDVAGVEPFHQDLVAFINEQILEMLSPANFPFTNPEVLEATRREKGENLARGMEFLRQDMEKRAKQDTTPDMGDFRVGVNIGITPGKVIFQNSLIELIQYQPTTGQVAREPVLVVPSWIMKYYILDLSPGNSLAKYLVDQGKTVFMISWKNPDASDRDVSMDDYLHSGLFAAIQAVQAVCPDSRINAAGYCIGGTLLSIGAAVLAREDNEVLNSITLFAAQTDFTEPGDIKRTLGASQLSFLDSHMWTDGHLSAEGMGASFMALRSRDLVWNPAIDRYFLGKEPFRNDLMAWNADGTRMPYKMHSRYLQELYIENRLAECRFEVDNKPVSLLDLRAPMFVVGTTTDHVAPWKSVYKIHRLTYTEVTFLLTNGGHNAGIVSGPSHPRRRYQMATHHPMDKYVDPDSWARITPLQSGSWWPAWVGWLGEHSSASIEPRTMGAPRRGFKILRDAPGEYVLG